MEEDKESGVEVKGDAPIEPMSVDKPEVAA